MFLIIRFNGNLALARDLLVDCSQSKKCYTRRRILKTKKESGENIKLGRLASVCCLYEQAKVVGEEGIAC